MGPGLIPRPVVTVIATVVIAVWALSQAASIFVADYEPPAEIHLAVMLVLGVIFGARKGDDRAEEDRAGEPPRPAPAPAPAVAEAAPGEAPEALPPGRVTAADLIARLQQERGGDDR